MDDSGIDLELAVDDRIAESATPPNRDASTGGIGREAVPAASRYFAATIRAMTFGSSGRSPTFARRGAISRHLG